jgi:hypothetical protein
VADDLLGTRLATPSRRGLALCIDLFFILLLTQVSSLVLAAVAAGTFFSAGNRLKTKIRFNAVRIFLRLLVALLLFVLALGMFDQFNESDSEQNKSENMAANNYYQDSEIELNGLEAVALTAKYLININDMKKTIVKGDCLPVYDCWLRLGEELIVDLGDTGLEGSEIQGVVDTFITATKDTLSEQQTEQLKLSLINKLQQLTAETIETINDNNIQQSAVEKEQEVVIQPLSSENPLEQGTHWLRRVIEELGLEFGLGLGWAAFYFSVFTAWLSDQTPGKRLMKIKVLKLDGKDLNLWESFGRYGGYSAGFATGLMGFLQVFWDPNRQAIQDKISETLVIDLSDPQVDFIKPVASINIKNTTD